MAGYAEGTSVPVERSRAEIERLLVRYGASEFATRMTAQRSEIAFKVRDRMVRLTLNFPDPNDRRFSRTPTGKVRKGGTNAEWEKEVRRLWRCLALVLQAKLEAVESRISTFDREFLADIVMQGGGTIGEAIIPRLSEAVTSGRLLGDGT